MPPFADAEFVPLASVLSHDHGLTRSDGGVRIVSAAHYVRSRIALQAPFVVPAVAGIVLILMRSASRDRLGLTIAGLAIVSPFLVGYLVREVRRTVTSRGPQLCLVSMPKSAVRLLDLTGSHVLQDVGGRVPRYPLVATGGGMVLGPPRRDGGVVETLHLRGLGVSVELECTARGRLARAAVSRHDESVSLAVRGRLRLKES